MTKSIYGIVCDFFSSFLKALSFQEEWILFYGKRSLQDDLVVRNDLILPYINFY